MVLCYYYFAIIRYATFSWMLFCYFDLYFHGCYFAIITILLLLNVCIFMDVILLFLLFFYIFICIFMEAIIAILLLLNVCIDLYSLIRNDDVWGEQ